MSILPTIKGVPHYSPWIKMTSNKLPSREQGRIPIKYINCGNLCKFGKKSLSAQRKFGLPFSTLTNFLPPNRLLALEITKSAAM